MENVEIEGAVEIQCARKIQCLYGARLALSPDQYSASERPNPRIAAPNPLSTSCLVQVETDMPALLPS